jgi:hypothetical protein
MKRNEGWRVKPLLLQATTSHVKVKAEPTKEALF